MVHGGDDLVPAICQPECRLAAEPGTRARNQDALSAWHETLSSVVV
jgi:hypothetical protein